MTLLQAAPSAAYTQAAHALQAAHPLQGPLSFQQRIHNGLAAGKKIVLFVRLSSAYQTQNSHGSTLEQFDQSRYLAQFGVPITHPGIVTIDARSESSRAKRRNKFLQLEEMIRRDQVVLILLSREDRIGRNNEDSARILALMEKRQVLVLSQGHAYDCGNYRDLHSLDGMFSHGSLDTHERMESSMFNRRAKAVAGRQRVKLPSGLVWADPSDANYIRAAKAAGLDRYCSARAIARHTVYVDKRGRHLHVLPFPDAEVEAACRLLIQFMRRYRSVPKVVDAINRGESPWPRAGFMPMIREDSFVASSPARWVNAARWRVRKWLRSRAVYGIYHYHAAKIAARAATQYGNVQTEIVHVDAFTGFAPSSVYAEIQNLLGERPAQIRTESPHPRIHALPTVFCGHPPRDQSYLVRDGVAEEAKDLARSSRPRCGRRLSAIYKASGNFAYQSLQCVIDDRHRGHAPRGMEDVVIAAALAHFDRASLKSAVTAIEVGSNDNDRRRAKLTSDIAALRADRSIAMDLVIRYSRESNALLAKEWQTKVDQLSVDLVAKERDLAQVEAHGPRLSEALKHDRERLLSLAADLPQLIERARRYDEQCVMRARSGDPRVAEAAKRNAGRVAAIMRVLVKAVYVREDAPGEYHLDIEYPSGAIETHVFRQSPVTATAAETAWITDRSANGVSAELIAEGLNALRVGHGFQPSWTTRRIEAVRTLAAMSPSTTSPGDSTTPFEPVASLARRLRCPVQELMWLALSDALGPAVVRDDQLCVAPSLAQIHRHFPEVGRRAVAHERSWPVDGTVSLHELREATGAPYRRVESAAASGAGIANDAAGRRYTLREAFALDWRGRLPYLLRTRYPAYAGLDEKLWQEPEQLAKHVHLSATRLRQLLPTVRLRTARDCQTPSQREQRQGGDAGEGAETYRTVVWADPLILGSLSVPSLNEAVAELNKSRSKAGLPCLPVKDFILRKDLIARLKTRMDVPSIATWINAEATNRIVTVRASHPEHRAVRPLCYIYAPGFIRAATRRGRIERWLRGE